MAAEGAEVLDIGAESSRPGSTPVSIDEELRRLLPVVKGLAARVKVPISVDTSKPEVARAALEEGASIINDIAANRDETAMWRIVGRAGAGYVCMHMQGTPQTMQLKPVYSEVTAEVEQFFTQRIKPLSDCGISAEQLILDPGIGFGKTVEHNVQLLASTSRFVNLGRPVLIGASRKGFMGKLLGAEVGERLAASLACACWAVTAGAHMIRAHDVAETVQAIRMAEALMAGWGKDRATAGEAAGERG